MTNEERILLGECTLAAFSQAAKGRGETRDSGLYAEQEAVLIDLLADLMHYAHATGLDYRACHFTATHHFTKERTR